MEVQDNGTKPCPFCGETIRLTAIKCRFCNEMLTGFRAGDRVVAVASPPTKSARETPRGPSTLRRVVGVVVLAGLGYFILQMIQASSSPSRPYGYHEGPLDSLRKVVAHPQVIVDEEVAVDAGGWQARTFTLSSPRPLQVVAQGRLDSNKGFSVYVMSSTELPNFKAHNPFRHIPAFQGLKTRSFSQTATLPAGEWTVVVANTENILNTMVVQLRVVADPSS